MPYRRRYIGDFARSQRDHPEWPVVLSEGDSWFSFADVVGRLDDPRDTGVERDQRAWSLLRLEKAGDEVMTILSGAQRAKLRDSFERWEIDALLFSAGGNDLVGADLAPLLKRYVAGASARDLLAESRFERRLRQIQDCYRELLDLLADAGQATRLFVNSYDYVVPSKKRAIYAGPFRIAGPWLEPALIARGIPRTLWGEVVALLIDAFATAIDQVAAEPRGVGRLIRVETRGVVRGDWHDELHPNRRAAMRLALAFEAALRSAEVLATWPETVQQISARGGGGG